MVKKQNRFFVHNVSRWHCSKDGRNSCQKLWKMEKMTSGSIWKRWVRHIHLPKPLLLLQLYPLRHECQMLMSWDLIFTLLTVGFWKLFSGVILQSQFFKLLFQLHPLATTGVVPFAILIVLNVRICRGIRILQGRRNRKDLNLAQIAVTIVSLFVISNVPRIFAGGMEVANTNVIIFCVENKERWVAWQKV